MALYKEQKGKKLTEEQFQNPTSEYRGAPFWAWNNKLDRDQLLRQIDYFKQMGMGGFHIHCRAGLDTPYMGAEYQSIVAACCQKAKQEGLLCWLYDEDRWPSGSAGGMVTKNSEYCQRRLIFTAFEHPSQEFVCITWQNTLSQCKMESYKNMSESHREISFLHRPGDGMPI